MEFLLDTANIEEIKELIDYLPISGVTTNPSIIKKAAPKDFFKHMREIRDIIGKDRTLHAQVIATDCEGMVEEARKIVDEIDKDVYIKVPATLEGIKAIKILHKEGFHITATAIYETLQAYMALEAGANYIAPYVNRMSNLGTDPYELIYDLRDQIEEDESETKIVAASFKGLSQVREALDSGAQAVTVSPELLRQIFANPNISKAVQDFRNDWDSLYA